MIRTGQRSGTGGESDDGRSLMPYVWQAGRWDTTPRQSGEGILVGHHFIRGSHSVLFITPPFSPACFHALFARFLSPSRFSVIIGGNIRPHALTITNSLSPPPA